MTSPVTTDVQNAEFWNSLCGSDFARELGITERSHESLRKYDQWYFSFYPYLEKHIPFASLRGRRVLEVGLGFGCVSQRLIDAGADYSGLDIARMPVEVVNYRAGREVARVGNILHSGIAPDSFDAIVAIGCYHHTGNLEKAIQESRRILKPSGLLVFMVYNALSYRHWWGNWKNTLRTAISGIEAGDAAMRAEYDKASGAVAPHTDFVTRRHLRKLCAGFRDVRMRLENCAREYFPFQHFDRGQLLRSPLPYFLGLDIYVRALK